MPASGNCFVKKYVLKNDIKGFELIKGLISASFYPTEWGYFILL